MRLFWGGGVRGAPTRLLQVLSPEHGVSCLMNTIFLYLKNLQDSWALGLIRVCMHAYYAGKYVCMHVYNR